MIRTTCVVHAIRLQSLCPCRGTPHAERTWRDRVSPLTPIHAASWVSFVLFGRDSIKKIRQELLKRLEGFIPSV